MKAERHCVVPLFNINVGRSILPVNHVFTHDTHSSVHATATNTHEKVTPALSHSVSNSQPQESYLYFHEDSEEKF